MADMADDTSFAADAAVFLCEGGLVESFPLPHGRRRWVASLPARTRLSPDPERLGKVIRERTGLVVRPTTASNASAFKAEHYCADEWVRGRVILAGDAAHVVSPIGGQGMNLGWLDAAALATHLSRGESAALPLALERYAVDRRRSAQRARRRAELFMRLGASRYGYRTRSALVGLTLTPPIAPHAARLFTMGGL
jgi:2-polyprenyl-6-methoxyphenol hydroxylase-like FAD-dependent oxidoreductase